jgi:hypothetical protein
MGSNNPYCAQWVGCVSRTIRNNPYCAPEGIVVHGLNLMALRLKASTPTFLRAATAVSRIKTGVAHSMPLS